MVLYELGGLAALEGNNEEAFEYLRQAIAHDKIYCIVPLRDIAWEHLWEHPAFQALIAHTDEEE